MFDALLSGRGVQGIVGIAAEVMRNPIVVVDMGLSPIVVSPELKGGPDWDLSTYEVNDKNLRAAEKRHKGSDAARLGMEALNELEVVGQGGRGLAGRPHHEAGSAQAIEAAQAVFVGELGRMQPAVVRTVSSLVAQQVAVDAALAGELNKPADEHVSAVDVLALGKGEAGKPLCQLGRAVRDKGVVARARQGMLCLELVDQLLESLGLGRTASGRAVRGRSSQPTRSWGRRSWR